MKLSGILPTPWGFKLFPLPPEGSGTMTQTLLGLGESSSLGSAEVMQGRNACKDITKKAERGKSLSLEQFLPEMLLDRRNPCPECSLAHISVPHVL